MSIAPWLVNIVAQQFEVSTNTETTGKKETTHSTINPLLPSTVSRYTDSEMQVSADHTRCSEIEFIEKHI
jgi:hypothetical protein